MCVVRYGTDSCEWNTIAAHRMNRIATKKKKKKKKNKNKKPNRKSHMRVHNDAPNTMWIIHCSRCSIHVAHSYYIIPFKFHFFYFFSHFHFQSDKKQTQRAAEKCGATERRKQTNIQRQTNIKVQSQCRLMGLVAGRRSRICAGER